MLTEEQARERAREWGSRMGSRLAQGTYLRGEAWVRYVTGCVENWLPALLLTIASEARQEERKRCEGLDRVIQDLLAGVDDYWSQTPDGMAAIERAREILRRMGEP